MRIISLAILCAALAIAPLRAQSPAADIRAVIESQIEAFRADDFETAFSFASPSIRRLFGTPSRFGEMVQNGYPMVRRPADVRFSTLANRNGRTVQSVVVRDSGGALHVLDYDMIAGDNGWRINGVTLRRPGDAGA